LQLSDCCLLSAITTLLWLSIEMIYLHRDFAVCYAEIYILMLLILWISQEPFLHAGRRPAHDEAAHAHHLIIRAMRMPQCHTHGSFARIVSSPAHAASTLTPARQDCPPAHMPSSLGPPLLTPLAPQPRGRRRRCRSARRLRGRCRRARPRAGGIAAAVAAAVAAAPPPSPPRPTPRRRLVATAPALTGERRGWRRGRVRERAPSSSSH
jgi:hypothetical protein